MNKFRIITFSLFALFCYMIYPILTEENHSLKSLPVSNTNEVDESDDTTIDQAIVLNHNFNHLIQDGDTYKGMPYYQDIDLLVGDQQGLIITTNDYLKDGMGYKNKLFEFIPLNSETHLVLRDREYEYEVGVESGDPIKIYSYYKGIKEPIGINVVKNNHLYYTSLYRIDKEKEEGYSRYGFITFHLNYEQLKIYNKVDLINFRNQIIWNMDQPITIEEINNTYNKNEVKLDHNFDLNN